MAQVIPAIFDDLLKQGAIAEDGTIQYRIFCDGNVFNVGDSQLTVVGDAKPVPPVVPVAPVVAEKPVTVEKPVAKPASRAKAKEVNRDQG